MLHTSRHEHVFPAIQSSVCLKQANDNKAFGVPPLSIVLIVMFINWKREDPGQILNDPAYFHLS